MICLQPPLCALSRLVGPGPSKRQSDVIRNWNDLALTQRLLAQVKERSISKGTSTIVSCRLVKERLSNNNKLLAG